MNQSPITRTVLLAALLALPATARAQESQPVSAAPVAPASTGPAGLHLDANLGGGGQLGAGSAYDPPGIFELEVGVAFDVYAGLSPQLSFVLGMSPGTSFAIRPGISWFVPETPFYLRAAFDASTQIGYLAWRWLLLGGGFALRVTDTLGFLAELDSGVPLGSGVGVPLLVRAGAFVRF